MSKKTKGKKSHTSIDSELLSNSLSQFTSGIINQTQLSKLDTIESGNRYAPISNQRNTLAAMYSTYGVAQTMIDQPVEDGLQKGFKIVSDELDNDDVLRIMDYLDEIDYLEVIKQQLKWCRLFGGGGLIIHTAGKATQPLNINNIKENTPLKFYAADLWELIRNTGNQPFTEEKPYLDAVNGIESFSFYGNLIHDSRLIKVLGKRAPSPIRPQLRGWGMSELERLVRSINLYIKKNEVIFDLLDEAKVDVWKLQEFNSKVASPQLVEQIIKRVQMASTAKNYMNAIVMDAEDDFIQKQINFAGLAEMSQEFRIQVASDCKMPMSKLFGIAPSGWGSREEENDNYNAMVESEVRRKFTPLIKESLRYVFQKVLGFIPEQFTLEFESLRMLGAEQEQAVKTAIFDRAMGLYDRGIIDSSIVREALNSGKVLDISLEISSSADEFPTPAPAKPKLDFGQAADKAR